MAKNSDWSSESEIDDIEGRLSNRTVNVIGYNYEPELDSDGSSTSDESIEERADLRDWCQCSNCTLMDSFRERMCCKENEECVGKLNDAITHYGQELPYSCIYEHQGFIRNCLLWDVLENAWLSYRQQYGQAAYEHNNRNKLYRHVAYRQLSRMLYGVVGRQNRYILPSCAVSKIRETFATRPGESTTGYRSE